MIGSRVFRRALEQSEAPRRKQPSAHDILQYVDVVDFLQTLGIEKLHKATSDEYNFACPFAGHTSGDANPSAYMNDGSKDKTKTTVWKCHGCARSGNGISFYAELEGISKQEAALHIRQTWAPGFRAPKGGSITAEFDQWLADRWERDHHEDEVSIIPWAQYNAQYSVDWDRAYKHYRKPDCDPIIAYLFERGFTADALANWQIGYDDYSERFTIPVSNLDGELVGVKGRAADELTRPKYLILGDRELRRPHYGFMPYQKAQLVFGLDRVKTARTLVLVEGELDVIALWQLRIPAVCTGSAHLSAEQGVLLRDHAEELILFFDSNDAGENAIWGYEGKDGEWHPGVVERLSPFLRLRVVEEHEHDASKLVQLSQIDELRRLLDEAPPHFRYFLL